MRLILLAAAVGAGAASAGSLVLLQHSAQKIEKPAASSPVVPNASLQALPPASVEDLVASRDTVYLDVETSVNTLKARLQAGENAMRGSLSERTAEYESELGKQRNLNSKVELNITTMTKEIAAMETSQADLRIKANKLRQVNAQLIDDIRRINGNISTAEEFAARAMDGAAKAQNKAEYLAVLSELAEKEKTEAAVAEREEWLADIAMLEFPARHPYEERTSDLIQSVLASADSLAAQEHMGEVILKKAFEKEQQADLAKYDALLKKQSDLAAARDASLELRARLRAALERLKEQHAQLLSQSKAIRAFATRLGARPMPVSVGRDQH